MIPDFSKYADIVAKLKHKIREARLQAALTINAQMLAIYWEIGNTIAEQEKTEGWGKKIVDTLAKDLKAEFPEMRGFSPRNLRYMRDFAMVYPHFAILQTMPARSEHIEENLILQEQLAKLSWYHHTTLLDKIKDEKERQFYIEQTVVNGWSRDIMVHQIESGLYKRQGQISSNFSHTIPLEQSELVQQIFKDPYKFDFIYLGEEAKERDLEDALTNQLTKFLLELGQWFSFMGRQYKMVLGENEYFFDLLFYHTRLKRYIVIDLKIDEFRPEYKGKMEFYLNLADDQLKTIGDEPSIGLILCKTKDGLVAEYALRDSNKPIGIAEYKINENLPDNIKGELPTIEELEAEIEKGYEELKSPVQKRFESIKEIVSKLQGDELKQQATTGILFDIIDTSVLPLYHLLAKRIDEFKEWFLFVNYKWQSTKGNFTDINQLAEEWKNEELLKNNFELNMWCNLSSFKKAGTETFNVFLGVDFKIDTNWYGFVIRGVNNQQPIVKKLYHEQLSKADMEYIIDIAATYIMDRIESQIEYLKKQ